MGSWVRTITTPFRKACTLVNPPSCREQKSDPQRLAAGSGCGGGVGRGGEGGGGGDPHRTALHGEVMACAYQDVQVMWSILDKSSCAERRGGGGGVDVRH